MFEFLSLSQTWPWSFWWYGAWVMIPFGGGWAADDTKAARNAWGVGLVFDAYLACRYRREICW
jgi:hypothetical protein